MSRQILFSAKELHDLRAGEDCTIVDCRFVLDAPDVGYEKYLESHIPGAVYAHLDNDLSSPVNDKSGRHPLPDADKFASFLARSGWKPGMTLVAYDDAGGAIAARLWWLLRYFDQNHAAMLDGGISAWTDAGYEIENGKVCIEPEPVENFKCRNDLVVSSSEVVEGLARNGIKLVDARSRERFMGEVEPIDSVAGHIPGSVNYPFTNNLTSNGMFKSPQVIRQGLQVLNSSLDSREWVHMCGSGVTACHNIFAGELAGIKGSKLYVGSWSEWIRDPNRLIAL